MHNLKICSLNACLASSTLGFIIPSFVRGNGFLGIGDAKKGVFGIGNGRKGVLGIGDGKPGVFGIGEHKKRTLSAGSS